MFDNLYNALLAFVNLYRDLYCEEFNKTGGLPPTSVTYRIDTNANQRITASGGKRITADSFYP